MRMTLRHPATGDFRFVDTGWSWSLFLGSGFFGLPLFFRGLAHWGCVMLVAWCLRFTTSYIVATSGSSETLDWILNIVLMALALFFGFKGNEMTANRYISLGYEVVNNDDPAARDLVRSWDY